MFTIKNTASVGKDGVNRVEDVATIQELLNLTGLSDSLKKKEWAKFAKGYNGPAYADNKYDTKLENSYNKYKAPAKK